MNFPTATSYKKSIKRGESYLKLKLKLVRKQVLSERMGEG